MTWIDCVVDDDYEISTEYPYHIRRKSNHRIIKEHIDSTKGNYVYVNLNGNRYRKHRIIAEQFIPNPNGFPCVDHINHDRTDYHVQNIRWCSYSDNCKNKSSHKGVEYEYIEDDDLPDDLIIVSDYGNHEFEDLYYSESMDRFLFYTGINSRVLHINHAPNDSAFVCAFDKNNKRVKVFYSKFKKLYGLRN